jgi:hypothetical protein
VLRGTNNPTQGLLGKSKLAQYASKEGQVLQIEPDTTYEKYKESSYVSDRPSDHSNQLGHLSHLESCCLSHQKLKNFNSIQCRLSRKKYFSCVGTIQRICLSSDDFSCLLL